jgi:hypothetical protein
LNYYNYFTEIEDAFVRRRGKNLLLSPIDWALIDGWQERGIPLHVVLRAIESVFDVFDKQPLRPRTVKSLLYCREEIEAQYAEWAAAQAGRSDDGRDTVQAETHSPEAIAEFIRGAASKLRSLDYAALAEDYERAASRLDELVTDLPGDTQLIERALFEIEKFVDRSLQSNFDREHLKVLSKEVSSQLKSYKAEMEPEAYKSTFDLMLLKRLREESGVPRLSLYYL